MCGIIGIVQKRAGLLGRGLGSLLREGLKRLEYRGYDSVGYAVVSERGMVVRKAAGKIDELADVLEFDRHDGTAGIGHTRWATHGPPTDYNAHPHTDCSGCIAVVHNGVLQNHQELREELLSRGHRIVSDTDTELIAHMIEELTRSGRDTIEALREVAKRVVGAYAILVLRCDEPYRIYFLKKISPLVIGLGSGYNMVSSDIPALLGYSKRVVVLEDGELGYISPEEIHIETIDGHVVDHVARSREVEWSIEMIDRGGYPHYMLKEIYEQPLALRQTLMGARDQVRGLVDLLLGARRVFITGAGTSYHAGLVMDYSLKYYLGIPSIAFISSEVSLYERVIDRGDLLIAVSQSGETIDTLTAVRRARERGARVLAVSNVVDSAIPRESHYRLYTRAGPEIGVAATKTFTTQVAALLYLLTEILREQDPGTAQILREELERAPGDVERLLPEIDETARGLAEVIRDRENMYVLGRDLTMPVSLEGALKIKEISYIHAEAYPAGESKHGPIALVDRGFPVAFNIHSSLHGGSIIYNIEEMRARHALVIAVAPGGEERISRLSDYYFAIPRRESTAFSILYVLPYQLLSYHLAVARGLDPDKPRNLAKTVTVE